MKKITAAILILATILTIPLLGSSEAMAASPTFTGAQFYASRKVDTRTSLSGANNGWIDAGDDCRIVSTGHMNGGAEYWLVNYPITGTNRRKDAYALKSAFVTVSPYEVKVSQTTKVYRTSSMSTEYGSIWTSDQAFVLSESGSNVWVIYPLDAGGYKIGWTRAANVVRQGGGSGGGQAGTVRVTRLTVNATDIRLGQGQTFQWNAIIEPGNASNKRMTYSSSDTSVATVSASGLVTAKNKNGQAYITVRSEDGGFQQSAIVTVTSSNAVSFLAVAVSPTVGDADTAYGFAATTSATVSSVTFRVNVGNNNSEVRLSNVSGNNWATQIKFIGYHGTIPITFNAYDASGKVVAAYQTSFEIRPASTVAHGLYRPITGTDAGYASDTGLDIAAAFGTDVFAVADGTLEYSQWGKTSWTTPPDTAYSVNIKLDNPITINGITYRYVFYTHLSNIVYSKQDGSSTVIRVRRGEKIGESGTENRNNHLHISFYDSRSSTQRNLSMQATRELFGSHLGMRWVAGQ